MGLLDGLIRGFASATNGYLSGKSAEDDKQRQIAERAHLQAVAEMKDQLTRQRQDRLDAQALKEYGDQQAQQGIANKQAAAHTALTMAQGGFTPFQAGTGQQDVQATLGQQSAQAGADMGAPVPGLAGVMQAASSAIGAKGQHDAPILADRQGGFLKTGLSDGERQFEENQTARREAQAATLADRQAARAQQAEARLDQINAQNEGRAQNAAMVAAVAGNNRQAMRDQRAQQQYTGETERLKRDFANDPNVKSVAIRSNLLNQIRDKIANGQPMDNAVLGTLLAKLGEPQYAAKSNKTSDLMTALPLSDRAKAAVQKALTGNALLPQQREQILNTLDAEAQLGEKQIAPAQQRAGAALRNVMHRIAISSPEMAAEIQRGFADDSAAVAPSPTNTSASLSRLAPASPLVPRGTPAPVAATPAPPAAPRPVATPKAGTVSPIQKFRAAMKAEKYSDAEIDAMLRKQLAGTPQ